MDASVIVPVRNSQDTLPRTLEALAAQDIDGDYEVIVVDDGSTDATAERARNAPGPVSVISLPAGGQAAARNAGAARAAASALAFCDADVFPTHGWLRAGLGALGRADIVQGKVLPDPLASLGPFDRSIWISSEVGLWEAANLFVRRELFERAGGFPEGIRPPDGKVLGEDVLLGYRVRRMGARSKFCPEALAYHAVFTRGWRSYVSERRRLEYFPLLALQAPELRETFFYRRVFLNRRTARLDAGLAGAALALAARSPLPLLAGWPYLKLLRGHSRRSRPGGPAPAVVAAADFAADLVSLVAMAQGSLRYRSLLL